MNGVKKVLSIIVLISLLQSNTTHALPVPLGTVVKIASASCIGAAAAKLVVDYGMLYAENKLIDQLLDMLVLECTPTFQLQKLPAKEYEAALRKKARLINIRKRVVTKVHIKSKEYSCEHQKNIQRYMRSLNAVFAVIDMVRRENIYEREYEKKAPYIDHCFEDIFVSSVILNTKPAHECSQQDLKQKKLSLEKKVRVAEKIKARGDKFILKHVVGLL